MNLTKEEWKSAIQQAAAKHFETIKSIRRHIHQHPELSFEEEKTSEFIKSQLRKHGISFSENWVKTGILAEIKGKNNLIIANTPVNDELRKLHLINNLMNAKNSIKLKLKK